MTLFPKYVHLSSNKGWNKCSVKLEAPYRWKQLKCFIREISRNVFEICKVRVKHENRLRGAARGTPGLQWNFISQGGRSLFDTWWLSKKIVEFK